jgi:alkyldihydroxyacetonephosphate synthase
MTIGRMAGTGDGEAQVIADVRQAVNLPRREASSLHLPTAATRLGPSVESTTRGPILMTRTRSHWGWGWADRWPDDAARAAFAEMLSAMRGLRCEPRPPVELEAIVLRPSAVRAVPPELADVVSTAREVRLNATWGRSFSEIVRAFMGDFAPAPDAVASPRNADEVAAVLRWAEAAGLAAIPRGGGTSVTHGVTARPEERRAGVVVIEMSRMARLIEVDTVSRAAHIEGGATGPRVQELLGPHELCLRHYPQSWEFATLGGWIVTRAGGHYATGRTHIDDFVESVTMVAPTGTMTTRRLPASGAGPDANRLVLGSEGTLGVVTSAWIRVQTRPRYRSNISILFSEFGSAVAAARALAQSNLFPTNCRVLDPGEAALNQVGDGRAVLIVAFEDDLPTRDRLEAATALAMQYGGVAPSGARHRESTHEAAANDAGAQWKDAFFDGPYLQSLLVSFGLVADTFETACTWSQFEALHAALHAAVAPIFAELGGGELTCRFTHVYADGPAPYYTFVCQSSHGRQLDDHARIKRAVSDVLSAHGATITHHHAVGRLHRPWYDIERPPLFATAYNAVRATFDPAGIMNPGVLTDPE